MRTAIVVDWLTQMGGAERVVLAIKELFPDAPIYTTVYNPDTVDSVFRGMDIRTSFIQKLPGAKKSYQKYLPLMPTAVEQYDLNEFDLVISSSSSMAKGIVTKAETVHICYCHTPMRYAWDFYHEYLNGPDVGRLKRKIIPWVMNYIRMWDRLTADRVDYFIANSHNVARRIKKQYRRDSTVIHPPVETSFFQPGDIDEDYFLIISRLVPYKRVDLAIEACNKLGLPLRVIGIGPEFERLKSIAGPTVKMMGRLTEEDIKHHYASCKAFLFPGEEDFGITPLEAQASGRPVIAFGKGGALETVVDGQTGVFFKEQTVDSVVNAIKRFQNTDFDRQGIRQHAEKYDKARFQQSIKDFVEQKLNDYWT